MHILNLGIVAHVDAGKTSLTERLLFAVGAIDKLGSVGSGNTTTDTLDLERKRGITIKAAVVSFQVGNTIVNLVDTPGHSDFVAEVERSLGVLDAAVVVVSAIEGLQAQTRVLMRTLKRQKIPFLIFVNKIDRVGANYDGVVAAIASQMQFATLAMSMVLAPGTKEATSEPLEFAIEPHRQVLLDRLAENDETLLTDFVLNPNQLTRDRLQETLASQVRQGILHPAFAGSAATGSGIDALICAVQDLLPFSEPDIAGPIAGRIFKIDRGWGREKRAYLALSSGSIAVRQTLHLSKGSARITAIDVFQSGSVVQNDKLVAGQIGRVSGLSCAVIDDVLGPAPDMQRQQHFALPTLETRVTARRPADRHIVWTALNELSEEDPLINLRKDAQFGEIYVSLYGQVQREVIASTLENDFGVEVQFHETTAICAERPTGSAECIETIGEGENPFFATVGLRVEPNPPGSGNSFALAVNNGVMPSGFYRAVEETVTETLKQGRYGWPVIDCRFVMTLAGQASPMSAASDFRYLTPLVVAECLKKAGTVVCEPISRFRIDAQPSAVGALLASLGQLGAAITSTAIDDRTSTLLGTISMSGLQTIQKQLPDLTAGTGSLESSFDHYAPMRSPMSRPRQGVSPFERSEYLANFALAHD